MLRVRLSKAGANLMNSLVDITQVLLDSLLPTKGIVGMDSSQQLMQFEFNSAVRLWLKTGGLNYFSCNWFHKFWSEGALRLLRGFHSTILC
jgi:hypothetical protein